MKRGRGTIEPHLVAAEVTRLESFGKATISPQFKASSPRLLQAIGLALGVAVWPSSALACAVCSGKSSDAMAQGMNMGILALLVVIVSVLLGLASFFVFLARQAARFASTAGHSAPGADSMAASAPLPQSTP
jgi:hypothetical protein